MSIINKQSAEDARKVRSGKDAAIYNGSGTLLAAIEEFKSSIDVKTAETQALGAFQIRDVVTGHKVTITFNELVVRDDQFIADIVNMMNNGVVPEWHFQGTLEGVNGSGEERMVYNNCVPSGSIDLQNFTAGDVIKRAMSLTCNGEVRLMGRLNQ